MKRIIGLCLCLAMVFSAVCLLASCQKESGTGTVVSKKTVEVDLANYSVVYGTELTSGGKQHANSFVTTLKELTTVTFRPQMDDADEVLETDDCEILIGQTARAETQKALKDVGSFGWTIRVFDTKIVIVGTTPFLTRVALSWFIDAYLNANCVSGTTITVNQKVVSANMEEVSLVDADGAGQYAIVYDDSVDTVTNEKNYAVDSKPTGGQATDYIYDLSVKIRELMCAKTGGANARTFPFKLASSEGVDQELLVGTMNRTEMKEEMQKLQANEYAVSVRNGKIMLVAWNDVTLECTYALLEDVLAGSSVEDSEGNSILRIPANCTLKEVLVNDWVLDFPKPESENIVLDGTVDVNNNSIEYIYSGSGVNREAFVSYCEKLESEGFAVITAETQWEGSSFRTYLNQETGVTLHVYHAAYTHAEEQGVKDALNSLRIVASTTDHVTIPDATILSPQAYTTITDTMITAIDLDYQYGDKSNFGLGQIITLADGTFIIIDGGQGGLSDNEDNLWNLLKKLYQKVHNKAPDSDNQIHVRGWIVTHDHGDHYGVFSKFIKKYGKYKEFKFDYLFFNSPSKTECYNSMNPGWVVNNNMETLQKSVTGGFKYIKVHTGQVFYLANARLEVLYTHEDIYPRKTEYFNNTTSVIRTMLTQKDEAGNSFETGCVWLGDVERIGSSRMRAMYGDFMKTDMVQVSHHASNGVEKELYNLIAPKIVWLPTDKGRYKNWCATAPTAKSDWRKHVDYNLCVEMESVEMIFVADDYDATLPISATGFAFDKLFNADNLEDISPNATTIIDKR